MSYKDVLCISPIVDSSTILVGKPCSNYVPKLNNSTSELEDEACVHIKRSNEEGYL